MYMEGLLHVAQHFEKRHVRHRVTCRAREDHVGAPDTESIVFPEHGQHRVGQRDVMGPAPLHVVSQNWPKSLLQIEFRPSCEPDFMRARSGQEEQIERQAFERRLASQRDHEQWDGDTGHRLAVLSLLDLLGSPLPPYRLLLP